MRTYLLTWPGWNAGKPAVGKLWLKNGEVLACESMQDFTIRRATARAAGTLERSCCTTWNGLQETLAAMPVERREPHQEPVEAAVIDEKDWVVEKPRPKPPVEEPTEAEINPRDMDEPWGRTSKCGGCKYGPCLLTKRQVAALPYFDAERFLESPVCYECKRQKREAAAEKRQGPNGRLKKIQQLIDALQACEAAGCVLSLEEMEQVNAQMRALGVEV